jgi:hypothetical protein
MLMAESTNEHRNGPTGWLSRYGAQLSTAQGAPVALQAFPSLPPVDIQRRFDLRASLDIEHDSDLRGDVEISGRMAGMVAVGGDFPDGFAHCARIRLDGLGRAGADLRQREYDLQGGAMRCCLDRRNDHGLQRTFILVRVRQ